MFSDAKWARYVGERGRPGMDGPPPDELHVIPANFTHLQAPQWQGIQDSDSIGYEVGFQIDPPPAGFPIGTILLVAPRDGGVQNIGVAGAAPDTRFVFPPGVWRYEGWIKSQNAVATLNFARWMFLGGQSTGITAATFRPLPGSANFWEVSIPLLAGGATAPYAAFSGTIYVPNRWIIVLTPALALVDADLWLGHLSVLPVYLFDEAGAT